MESLLKRIRKIAVILLLLFCLSACSNEQSTNQTGTDGNMTISIDDGKTIRNGTEYYTYQVDEGHKGSVSVQISKESGQIDVDVYRVDCTEKPNYIGKDLDSVSFEVILKEPGEYKVCVTSKDYIGDYVISCSIGKEDSQ